MKKIFFLSCLAAGMLATACTDFAEEDDIPSGMEQPFTAQSMAPANTTIAALKAKYSDVISGSSFKRVDEDLIFEGVVVANDISGNLYQTLVVRDGDDATVLAVNDYNLYAQFPVGTRIRVNMNGLYMGGYGKMPKIGTPYYTSSGNLKQGAILKTLAATNIYIVGYEPDCYETQPIDIDAAWLKSASKDQYAPMLVRMKGVEIHTMVGSDKQRCPVYATSDFEDDGYGVNDTIMVGSTKLIFRCSTSAAFAFDTVPTGKVDIVGVMTRYTSTWQFQIRDGKDVIAQ